MRSTGALCAGIRRRTGYGHDMIREMAREEIENLAFVVEENGPFLAILESVDQIEGGGVIIQTEESIAVMHRHDWMMLNVPPVN